MLKFGILFCAYNNEETIKESLKPWLNREDCVVSVCSSPFKEYKDLNQLKDKTQEILQATGGIDHLWLNNSFEYDEAYVRNKALRPLIQEDCDYIWIVDGDEIYSKEQIDSIIKYVKKEEFVTWFSVCFKNYVFDRHSYYLGFKPPRIFKSFTSDYFLNEFYFDNDISYKHRKTRDIIQYKQLSFKEIPQKVALIDHITWLSNETSRLKVEYQFRHFGHGMCSYKWNYEENCLEFNDDFYRKTGQPKPKIFQE